MTDHELDQKLNAARLPKLEPDYIEDFPRLIFEKLRFVPTQKISSERHGLPRLVLSVCFAIVFLVVVFAIGHWHGKTEMAVAPANDILANAKLINETLAMFPNRIRAIIQNEHGIQLVLANAPDVPDSAPLYVHICDGKKCSSLVTFSGQALEIASQKITVLADANGGIILEGNKFIWSNTTRNKIQGGLKIEAKNLALEKL